jgi:hypothetical protein
MTGDRWQQPQRASLADDKRPASILDLRDHAYWALPDRLLAGEYPGSRQDDQAREKLRAFLAAGVTFFLDLTEPQEHGLRPYARLLEYEAATMGVRVTHCRKSIPDNQVPTRDQMVQILATLDEALAAGKTAYVHCYGGIGRTGTVVGCFLVERGMSGMDALSEVGRLHAATPDGDRPSPETPAQQDMVLNWAAVR